MHPVATAPEPAVRAWPWAPQALVLVLALGACQGPPAAPAATQASNDARPHLQWQGTRRCVDCRGIDVQLVLYRGADDRYALTETFHTRARAARFVEHGRWQRQGTRLQLLGDGGALRAYALLPDGRLQPRDLHGGVLPSTAALRPAAGEAR